MTRDELIGKLRNHWGHDMRELMHAAANMLEADAKPLTDAEIVKCVRDAGYKTWDSRMFVFAHAVEAKILERKK